MKCSRLISRQENELRCLFTATGVVLAMEKEPQWMSWTQLVCTMTTATASKDTSPASVTKH